MISFVVLRDCPGSDKRDKSKYFFIQRNNLSHFDAFYTELLEHDVEEGLVIQSIFVDPGGSEAACTGSDSISHHPGQFFLSSSVAATKWASSSVCGTEEVFEGSLEVLLSLRLLGYRCDIVL